MLRPRCSAGDAVSIEERRRNFDFYYPLTTGDSILVLVCRGDIAAQTVTWRRPSGTGWGVPMDLGGRWWQRERTAARSPRWGRWTLFGYGSGGCVTTTVRCCSATSCAGGERDNPVSHDRSGTDGLKSKSARNSGIHPRKGESLAVAMKPRKRRSPEESRGCSCGWTGYGEWVARPKCTSMMQKVLLVEGGLDSRCSRSGFNCCPACQRDGRAVPAHAQINLFRS